MSMDRVICPQCGAENISSPLITMCSSCLGSLEGAKPAGPRAPEPAVARAEPQPAPGPADFQPPRAPDVTAPIAAPPVAPETPALFGAEPPPLAAPSDFRPPRAEAVVPALEVPTGVPAEPSEEAAPEFVVELDPTTLRPLKLICPNCLAANPPDYTRCNLCDTLLPRMASEVASGMQFEYELRSDSRRGGTVGQTKWGAACGCVVMAFMFFLILLVVSALR